jgi:hypothetical protein
MNGVERPTSQGGGANQTGEGEREVARAGVKGFAVLHEQELPAQSTPPVSCLQICLVTADFDPADQTPGLSNRPSVPLQSPEGQFWGSMLTSKDTNLWCAPVDRRSGLLRLRMGDGANLLIAYPPFRYRDDKCG